MHTFVSVMSMEQTSNALIMRMIHNNIQMNVFMIFLIRSLGVNFLLVTPSSFFPPQFHNDCYYRSSFYSPKKSSFKCIRLTVSFFFVSSFYCYDYCEVLFSHAHTISLSAQRVSNTQIKAYLDISAQNIQVDDCEIKKTS